jgi:hypothetical protein
MSNKTISKTFKKAKVETKTISKSFTVSNKSYVKKPNGGKMRTIDLGFRSQFYSPAEIFSTALNKMNEEAINYDQAMKSLKEVEVSEEMKKKHTEPVGIRTKIALFIRKNKIKNKFLQSMLRRRKWTKDQESKIIEILCEKYNYAI